LAEIAKPLIVGKQHERWMRMKNAQRIGKLINDKSPCRVRRADLILENVRSEGHLQFRGKYLLRILVNRTECKLASIACLKAK
jgi:hypothetical protein